MYLKINNVALNFSNQIIVQKNLTCLENIKYRSPQLNIHCTKNEVCY